MSGNDQVQDLHIQLIGISLAYGLAFYAIALAIVLVWRRDSELPFTRALPFLAVFGFLQGLAEFLEVLVLLHTEINTIGILLSIARSAFLGLSYLFLLSFGIGLVTREKRHRLEAQLLAPALFLAWVVVSVAFLQVNRLPMMAWPSIADESATWLLSLPGGVLAIWGLHRHKKVFDQIGLPRAGMDCIWAGVLFATYAGVKVAFALAKRPSYPDLSGHEMLMSSLGTPEDAIQAGLAIGIAFFILRIVLTFQQELRGRVEQAEMERCKAQQEALEAHEVAEEQLRRWNETLEQGILSRTHELARRQEEADALYRISIEISALVDLDTILISVADKSRRLLRADLATVVLSEDGQNGIQVRTRIGSKTELLSRILVEPGVGLVGKVLLTGEPFRTDDYLRDSGIRHSIEMDAMVTSEGLRAHLSVPVRAGEQVVAVLTVASRGDRCFNTDDEWMLDRIAVLTGLAIQNSRLHKKAQQIAVLEERERLGREIHDGLAQTLGFIGMMCGAAQDRLERRQTSRVAADLAEIEEMARGAYSDAREAILGLRVSSYGGQGIVSHLREYLDRFREQTKLETNLKIHPSWTNSLGGDSEIQLMRIVQEALSNVRKHAEATSVSVELAENGERPEIAIQDDGLGFDVQRQRNDPGSHFGMLTMGERSRSIGAELTVQSAPGRGTRVLIRLPKRTVSANDPISLSTVA